MPRPLRQAPPHDARFDTHDSGDPATPLGGLLTSAEVASLIRVPHATLRYWRHIGIGPRSFKMGPKRVLYREEDVLAWVVDQYGAAG
jgi:hypothetical protein